METFENMYGDKTKSCKYCGTKMVDRGLKAVGTRSEYRLFVCPKCGAQYLGWKGWNLPIGAKQVSKKEKEELEKQGWNVVETTHHYIWDKSVHYYLMRPGKKIYKYTMIPPTLELLVTSPPERPPPEYRPPTPTELKETKCFIATATYGTGMKYEIDSLRYFRDNSLEPKLIGKVFINCYYKISPSIAKLIIINEKLRAVTRFILNPIVKALKRGEKNGNI